jgi:steroid 5-alpha reductase family enzyme
VLREKISPAQFFIFNVVFIATAQNILLCMITMPTYSLLLIEKLDLPITRIDNIFPRVMLGFVLIEFFADQQQWGMYFSALLKCH